MLLADRVGILWHEVQVTGFESISTPLAWLAAIAYSMEIYFDFWGYSLMAMGLGQDDGDRTAQPTSADHIWPEVSGIFTADGI